MKRITKLEPDEVFVFGSNEAGIHGCGAAHDAYLNFGAEWTHGYGHHGQSFAIPTKDHHIKTLPLSEISCYVSAFLVYAGRTTNKKFIVTPIGCGLAGYNPSDIKPFFKNAPPNVILPEEFK